jgi:serine/threonine protein kinase
MNKYNLVRCEQKANVMNEKKILSECDSHPFVLELFQTFQDRDFLYMLLEFVQGGELFSIMQEKYRFPLYPTMFYSACIVDVFEHVHSLNVVYRDLKPENVLVDRLGYVKLADFGFAKRVFDKTYTLCGTPEYLAPEVVLGSGHDKGVDYWGIGILIYEMLLGMSPFADEYDEDQHVVCNNIVRGRVGFEKLHRAIAESESKIDPFWTYAKRKNGSTNTNKQTPLYPEVEDLIKRLLNKNPIQRLGNLKDGARDVKRHSFFAELNWEDLRARRFPPPYVPNVKSSDDTSRFDVFEPDAAWPAYKGAQDWCIGF